MDLKQEGHGIYAQKKYSELGPEGSAVLHRSEWAVSLLVENGYALMNSYTMNEILNVIRALRELGLEYTLKTIQEYAGAKKTKNLYYEFTTVYFLDDRKDD